MRHNPIERAKRNPRSLRLAVNAKCYDCQGRDADPGVKRRIGRCEISNCSLYPVRPYQKTVRQVSENGARKPVSDNQQDNPCGAHQRADHG